MKVQQLIKGNRILLYEEFSLRYPNVTNWLEYRSLIDAIPSRWKRLILEPLDLEANVKYLTKYEKLEAMPKVTKVVYSNLVDKGCVVFDSYNKWNTYFELIDLELLNFERYERSFSNLYKISISVKLRDFQYRLLHKRVPTNYELYKWNIKRSKVCDFCVIEDNIIHTLFQCKHVANLWQKIIQYLSTFTHVSELNIDAVSLLINDVHSKPVHITNTLVLIGKQLIYRCKCQGSHVTYEQFFSEVQAYRGIEKYNAMKNNKVAFHQDKWSIIEDHTNACNSNNINTYVHQYIASM